MIIGPVTTVSSFTGCVFSVPVTQIGTGNESVQIDIVVTGPDGSTHSATKTVTKSGTVSMTIDDPPLLAGANYTAVVTVTGNAEGSVTKNVSFTTLASAPTLGAFSTLWTPDPYMVVDLSGGASATSYPVSYLAAGPEGGWTEEYKTTKLVMRRIEAGTFTMGSPSDEIGRNDSIEDLHSVTLTKPFNIGVFEVTQEQWELVMGSNPSSYTGETRPVENVSYDTIRGSSSGAGWPSSRAADATSFMGKLRERTGVEAFDLPTEAQWEYACRAGTTTALNSGMNLTSISNDASMAAVGRYSFNTTDATGGHSQHTAVGSYLPNAWGLYDMHGNVRESCLDWHTSSLGTSAATDPVGASSGTHREARGGSWKTDARYCRSANRGGVEPQAQGPDLGFRLSMALPELTIPEDVSATLILPVTAIGAGNAYVDVLVTADGADGSSVTGEVQRVSADGGVVEVTLTGLTPYTEYTATAVATSSSGGTATRTLSFTTRASDPQIGAVFVMSQQDTAGAFLVPVNAFGAGNTEVTIKATAFGDDGTRAESSTICTALGNNYATISGLSPGTPYDVTITVTGNHGGSATASATITTTGTRTTIVSVVIDGDTLPTRWLIDNGIIQNSLGLTEADLIELWGTRAANGMTLHECYVAGLDPGDPDANLVAYIAMDEADEPVITWEPDFTPDRVYTVEGKETLSDAEWASPSNAASRFYRVKVELPE